MKTIPFEKYQGLGNDFVLFDLVADPVIQPPDTDLIARICNRRKGVGADGILLFCEKRGSSSNAVRMIYFNADGSRAETCVNGIRCIALHAVRTNMFTRSDGFVVVTDAGNVDAVVDKETDTVETTFPGPELKSHQIRGEPAERMIDREFNFNGTVLVGTALSFGNPHFIVWRESGDLPEINREAELLGNLVEKSPHFPDGTNFEIAVKRTGDKMIMAVWERGVGITHACGSGAAAAVCAGVLSNRFQRRTPVEVQMTGGNLTITADLSENTPGIISGSVRVRGEAQHVFSGRLDSAKWDWIDMHDIDKENEF